MTATELTRDTSGMDALKVRLKNTWMSGDYDQFCRYMEKDSAIFFDRLGVRAGDSLLDVACGAGQLALMAARIGALTCGCDIAANWIVKARDRAAAEGLNIAFREGDAEALPYADAQFDIVASIFGAMFAPRPELVAAELVRVCRPGGRIAMANWTAAGFIGRMFKVVARHTTPTGVPSPVLWGDELTVRDRFGASVSNLSLTRRLFCFDYPFPPEGVVDFFRQTYGPIAQAPASVRDELIELWSEANRNTNGGTTVDAEYLEVIATRSTR